MPTSMGKDSTPTDNGVYIIGDRFEHLVMDSSTYGVPVNSSAGIQDAGRLRDANVLQRHLLPLGAVVGGQTRATPTPATAA